MEEHKVQVSYLDDDGLDPRVQIELEKLNVATDEINHLEATLEEANNSFRSNLAEISNQLQTLSKKLGQCVEKARPYYEATERAKMLQFECQKAAVQFQRASAVHEAAKETISLAEERFSKVGDHQNNQGREFNSAWQEMLNHATMKIMEAEAQKSASGREHSQRAAAYTAAEREVQDLHRVLKGAINKSRPYFEHRIATQIQLEAQKNSIHELQREVSFAKSRYSHSLRNLEQISEQIHEHRRVHMKREPGVGAETEPPQSCMEDLLNDDLCDEKAKESGQYWNDLKGKLNKMDNENNLKDVSEDSPHIQDSVTILQRLPTEYSTNDACNTLHLVSKEGVEFASNTLPFASKKGSISLISRKFDHLSKESAATFASDEAMQDCSSKEGYNKFSFSTLPHSSKYGVKIFPASSESSVVSKSIVPKEGISAVTTTLHPVSKDYITMHPSSSEEGNDRVSSNILANVSNEASPKDSEIS